MRQRRKGQVMILAVLALGGALLGATTIAGLLMVYQIRQSTDLRNSSVAIFAADTGIEWALYQFFRSTTTLPTFTNGATVAVDCYDAQGALLNSCRNASTTTIQSVGTAAGASRAFEGSITIVSSTP